jgi:hypothetical protein
VCPETKYSQMSATPTLMGLNNQSFYRLDPRLPGEKQVSSRRFVHAFSQLLDRKPTPLLNR